MIGAGTLTFTGSATLGAKYAITGDGTLNFNGAANLTADPPSAHLDADGTLTFTGAASLKALARLSADGTLNFNGSAVLSNEDLWESDDVTWDLSSSIDLGRYPVGLVGQSFVQFSPAYSTFGGTDIASFVERQSLPANSYNGMQFVDTQAAVIMGDADTQIDVYVGAQERTVQDTVAWEGPYEFILGEDDSADLIVSGRFLSIRFEALGQPHWTLTRYDPNVQMSGDD